MKGIKLFTKQHTATHADLEEVFGKRIVNITKENLLDLIPKDRFSDPEVDSDIYFTTTTDPWRKNKTIFNRVNMLWVYPLWLVLVGPVLWISTGKFGIEQTSKCGIIITKLIGE